MSEAVETDGLVVDYFDGLSSVAHCATLSVQAGQLLVISLEREGVAPLRWPLAQVQWSERTRYGARSARLPGGASLQSRDLRAWDAFVRAQIKRDSWVVRVQQSWRGVAVASVLLVVMVAAMYRWGLPLAADAITPMIPAAVDEAIGRSTLSQLDGNLLKPSTLPLQTQERLRSKAMAVIAQLPAQGLAAVRIEFRHSSIGPNAVALPGGTVVVTDELVKFAPNDDMVLGVLGHEFGHVQFRHGMRQLVQVTALQAALSMAMGDYASFLTTAPLVIAAMGYSRDHERQADHASVRFMRVAGISPAVMAGFFERIQSRRDGAKSERSLGISIVSSHPDEQERIDFFKQAATQP